MTAHVIAPRQQAHGPRPRERRDGHITLILGFEPSVSSFLWFPIPRVRVMSAGRSFQSWAHPCPTCEAGGPCPTCEAPSHPWAHLSSPGGPFQPWAHPCQAPPGGPSQPWAHPSQAPGSPFEMRRTTARDDRSPGGALAAAALSGRPVAAEHPRAVVGGVLPAAALSGEQSGAAAPPYTEQASIGLRR